MRPSHRFSYALKAMVDLAVHQGIGPVTTAAIAKRQGIPVRSLEQLFNRLRRKGLVQAERGPRGGYRLGKPADKIPVRAVFETLELSPASSPKQKQRPGGDGDPVRTVWKQVESAVQTTLEATTIGALAAQLRDQATTPIRHRYTFHI